MYYPSILHVLTLATLALARDYSTDLTNNGPYQIARCGAETKNSNATRLQTALSQTGAYISDTLIPTAQQGVNGSMAFANFFTTNTAVPDVVSIFQQMIAGAPVKAYGGGQKPVKFTCLNYDDSDTTFHQLYEIACAHGANGWSAINSTEYILICPGAWKDSNFLTSSACPKLQDNQLAPNNNELGIGDVFSNIINELAIAYGVGYTSKATEVFDIQDAIDLPAANQTSNAANFGLFANGKPLPNVSTSLHNKTFMS